MNRKSDREIVIKLNASYKVKHEKFENFGDSYFAEVYDQASQIVKEIIDSGRNDFDAKDGNEYTEPISNLIAFSGKRGSGKTSAMLSFCDFLTNYQKYRNDGRTQTCGELLQMQDKVSFTVLESIDATLVSKPRELIGAILGKMLVAIKEKERIDLEIGNPKDIEIRKLKSRLGDIYSSMRPSDTIKNDVAPGEVLEQLSRSWNQQEAFRRAVDRFNKYMVEYKNENKQNYLVVPIDDVDMNLKNGYKLLEAIRKYLMAPNVIVLLAADYHQLGKLCVKTYKKLFNGENKDKSSERVMDGQSEELALEYLEKLIPTGRRIYMPELYQEEMLYGRKILIENEKGERLSIKRMILWQVWEHVGILLNMNAEVKHWLLPHSLRKLSNYINSMHSLLDYTDADKDVVFKTNISWFYDDLTSRYLNEKDIENNDYKAIISIIDKFNNMIPERKIPELIIALEEEKYKVTQSDIKSSYGFLLEQLYKLRGNSAKQTLVQAASFAVSLYLRTYIYAIENDTFNDKEEKNKIKKEFLKVTRGEFWGDLDQFMANEGGQATKRILTKTRKEQELYPFNDLSEYELLILTIQLGLTGDREGEVCGTFRFGNFIDVIFDYEERIQAIADLLKEQGCFSERAKEIQNACDCMIDEYRTWELRYGTSCVIPFYSAEFMFDLYERLYGAQGKFRGLSELNMSSPYYMEYEQAINEIGDVLEDYDIYYDDVRTKYNGKENIDIPKGLCRTYSDIYRDCPFIRFMREEKYVKERKRVFSKYLYFFFDETNQENMNQTVKSDDGTHLPMIDNIDAKE